MVKKWIKSNILDIIQVTAIVGAAVTGIIVWLQQAPWYMVVLFVLVSIALMLNIINGYASFRERHKKGFSSLSNEDMEAMLRKWLDKRQYALTHKPHEQALFRFEVKDKQERPVTIFRPKDDPAVIKLLLVIDEEELKSLPPKEQEVLRFRIGVDMAGFGLLYNDTKPMMVELDLPCDDLLTQSIFLAAIDKLRQATVLMAANVRVVLAISSRTNSQAPHKKGSQKQ